MADSDQTAQTSHETEGESSEALPSGPPTADTMLAMLHDSSSIAQDTKVIAFEVAPAAGPGANFLGDLWRVRLTLSDASGSAESLALILKRTPSDELKMEFVRAARLFEVEGAAYAHVLPRMASALLEAVGAACVMWPRMIAAAPDHSELVLEDLSAAGFTMADKRRGLSLAQSRAVMRTLGRQHASSVALHVQDPVAMEPFQECLFREATRIFLETYLRGAAQQLSLQLRDWPEMEHLADRVEGLQETFWDQVIAAVTSDPSGFNVLNHGDLWVNNILFRRRSNDDGQEETTTEIEDPEAAFIDWQSAVWTSPALDLLYFLYSSPSDEVRSNHEEALLEEYHGELVRTLTALGLSAHAPSLEALKEDLLRRLAIALFPVVAELPNILAPGELFYDLGQYFEENPPRNETYALPGYTAVAQRLLPMLAERELF